MNQLSGLDALFLHLETPEMPMHVGALHLFELPASYRGNFVRDMRQHMAARLALAPALRRRLHWLPMNFSNPAWVEAEPDLTRHVVAVKLPPGSDLPALQAEVGRLHPQLLDRTKPLWKFHVFEGLAHGANGEKRYAMYTQLHHAAVDGQAAVALAQVILDPVATGRELPAVRPRREKLRLGMAEMLRGALSQQIDQIGSLAKTLPGAVSTVVQMATEGAGKGLGKGLGKGAGDTLATMARKIASGGGGGGGDKDSAGNVRNFALAPKTRLNVSVSSQRSYAALSVPIATLKDARKRLGITLNDAVIFLCSGALRRFFKRHGPLPKASLVAAVPISLRAKGDTSSNNQASMTLLSLGTHIAKPAERLKHVLAATAAMKATMASDKMKELMPTDFPSMGMPWLVQGLTRAVTAGNVAEKIPAVANVVISNVPGPQVPLFMAGARMVTNFPASIVVHGVALNITVQTYDQSLDIGLIACARALPEVAELIDDLQAEVQELVKLAAAAPDPMAQPAAPAPVTPAKPAKPASRKAPSKPSPKAKLATKTPASSRARRS
jgi:diacylglycerol O-acyltransferase / wax synthase